MTFSIAVYTTEGKERVRILLSPVIGISVNLKLGRVGSVYIIVVYKLACLIACLHLFACQKRRRESVKGEDGNIERCRGIYAWREWVSSKL